MDSYKKLFYKTRGFPKSVPAKSLSERKQLRRSLHCNSFHWYLTNIYPELRIPLAEEAAYGEIKQIDHKKHNCITDEGGLEPSLHACHSKKGDQDWSMTKSGLIRSRHTGKCLKASNEHGEVSVAMTSCNNKDFMQHWKLMIRDRIRHAQSNLCLETMDTMFTLAACKEEYVNQQWKFTTRFIY